MFDFVHEKKRLVQIVLGIIILPFALWGVDSYRNAGGPEFYATVNGEKISKQEFENALEQQRQRMREMAGSNFDPAMFDKAEIKHTVLDSLVTRRLLATEAGAAGLMPSDEQLAQFIANVDLFQRDGKFDIQRYEAALSERGMNRLGFEARLRQDIAAQQLTDAYASNGFASTAVVERLIRLNEQQRTVSLASLEQDAFLKQVKLSDEEVADYYAQHAEAFQLTERANVEYVVFSVDGLLPSVSVSDADVQQYYDEHLSEFSSQEQRQAAHILIAADKQAGEAEKQAAKVKAEQILQQLKQAPAKFSALAKEYSEDPGSAGNGGDLGMFGRGAMVKPFEDSVFSLKTGEISGVVQSDFGFHIIKLLSVKAAKAQPLAEVRSMIAQRIKSQRAADMFAELAEKFGNTVYEQSDTLKPAADLVNVAIKQGGWLSKGQPPAGIWSEKVLQAVFSDDVVKDKRNTAAIEIGENAVLAARVVEYKPATTRALAEVAAGIRQTLKTMRARELAEQQGKEMLERLVRGEKPSIKWQAKKDIARNDRPNIEPELMEAIFRADVGSLPQYVGVPTPQGGYALARIDAVKDTAVVNEMKLLGYAQQIRQMTGEELLLSFINNAKQGAEITMKDFAAGNKE